MRMLSLKIILVVFVLYTDLLAEMVHDLSKNSVMKKIEYQKAKSLYVNKISFKIAQELYANSIKEKRKKIPINILPIVNLYDSNKTTLATRKIDENLIYAMFVKGYKIIDNATINKINLNTKKRTSPCVLYSTYTNYKNGMLINSRIIDTNSNIIYSTSQVFVNKRELKSINKLYNKYGWFSE